MRACDHVNMRILRLTPSVFIAIRSRRFSVYYSNLYAQIRRKARAHTPPETTENVLTVGETYLITKLWMCVYCSRNERERKPDSEPEKWCFH